MMNSDYWSGYTEATEEVRTATINLVKQKLVDYIDCGKVAWKDIVTVLNEISQNNGKCKI